MADGIEGRGFSLLEASCVILSTSLRPSHPPGVCCQVWTLLAQSCWGYEARVFIARFLMAAKGTGVINEKKCFPYGYWRKAQEACFSSV